MPGGVELDVQLMLAARHGQDQHRPAAVMLRLAPGRGKAVPSVGPTHTAVDERAAARGGGPEFRKPRRGGASTTIP